MTNKLSSKDYSWILMFLFIIILIMGFISTTSLGPLIQGRAITVISGHIKRVSLETTAPTTKWVGITITNSVSPLSESALPFYTINVSTFSENIETYQFPGANLKDGNHYYGAMIPDEFNSNYLVNVTPGDLDENGTFSSSEFSIFYPGYETYNTNPNKTFCCDTTTIEISNVNYTVFNITLAQDVTYYLINYNESGNLTPLFLCPFEDTICYDGSGCVAQFMLPRADYSYNFYTINKHTPYDYDVWIDGVSTSTFSQTAQPYNLTIKAFEVYTGNPADTMQIIVGEENGQNIFIPYRLSGYISNAYSIGLTDSDGFETFLVTPTATANSENYSIYVGMLIDGTITSKKELDITTIDEIVFVSKPISPTRLYDNAKAATNAMNQINSYLYRWASEYTRARKIDISYELTTNTFTITPEPGGTTGKYIVTGAVNVLEVAVKNGGFPQPGYSVRVKEKEGYLILNPYTDNQPLTDTEKIHLEELPTDTEFIITPTSLGLISSNVTIEVLNSGGGVVDTLEMNISPSLELPGAGNTEYYSNDLLKTVVNAMNQVLYSLYYSLNF